MNLSTKYNGLTIENPIIVGSSGLTNTVEKNIQLEKNKAGAVVLKSLFEEQILKEVEAEAHSNTHEYPEAYDYIKSYVEEQSINKYLELIQKTKAAIDIPVIASINCVTASSWTDFAKEIETAGADALELNISALPTNVEKTGQAYEQNYFDIIEKVSKLISIPISLKLNTYSSGLANLIQKLDWTEKIKSFIMFNRFYSPDFDINTLKITSSNSFSSENEQTTPLRWVALLSDVINAEIIASTGIHTGESAIKQILAGANAVQVVSAIYKNGGKHISEMLNTIESWMQKHGFNSIDDFKGKLSYKSVKNPSAFERIQFMKYYGGIE